MEGSELQLGLTGGPEDSSPSETVSVSEETVSEVSAPTEPASTSESAPDAGPEEPAPRPSADDFGWSEWDGAPDALPEEYRPWAQQILAWAEARHSDAASDLERLREQYQSWMDGVEDPRIAELTSRLESRDGEYTSLKEEYDAAVAEYRAYQEAVEARFEAEQARLAEEFKSEHGWIFDGGAKEQLAGDLLDEGWPLGAIPSLLKSPPSKIAKARELFGTQEGLEHSAREDRASLVMQAIAAQAPARKKNRASEIVSGSESTPSQSPRIDDSDLAPENPRQARLAAARRSMRRHKRSA